MMKSLGLAALFVVVASLCSSCSGAFAMEAAQQPMLIAQVPQGTRPAPDAPHIATPATIGELDLNRFPGLRDFLEDQQNAHDKLIVDRFLLGVAILFAVIAAALLFSLPPKPRAQRVQKE